MLRRGGPSAGRPVIGIAEREHIGDKVVYFAGLQLYLHLARIVVRIPQPGRERRCRHALLIDDRRKFRGSGIRRRKGAEPNSMA